MILTHHDRSIMMKLMLINVPSVGAFSVNIQNPVLDWPMPIHIVLRYGVENH